MGPGLDDADASGDALADGDGDGVGDVFFFRRGDEEGEADGEGDGETVGELFGLALGEAVAFGVGDAAGLADGLGEAPGFGEGVGVGDVFFFVLLELFRFFGGGVGWKIRLISWPNDCAPASRNSSGGAPSTAQTATTIPIARARRIIAPVPSGLPCSAEYRLRGFRAGSFR